MTVHLHKNQVGQTSLNGGEFAAKVNCDDAISLDDFDSGTVSFVCGNTMVEFRQGDEFDGENTPLLRASVLRRAPYDAWAGADDETWSTLLPVGTSPDALFVLARDTASRLDRFYDPEDFSAAARRVTQEMQELTPEGMFTFLARR